MAIDFKKKLISKATEVVIDPIKLYDTLDRATDKGPLRPAQEAVLSGWFSSGREKRDIIVKLHTGQGKTLIGLLMLQSRLNEKKGPALYLCPDNYLIEQSRAQAKQFGITTCIADPDIPDEFSDGKKILVTSVQKLFNGLTKFGLGRRSLQVGALLMDDAHACSDIIREQTRIRLPKDDQAYSSIRALFATELEQQGIGTYADICHDKHDALLPVPYWAWVERESEVARILSSGSDRKPIKFAWPLLKNILGYCQCLVSGGAVEIEPYIPPLDLFGTYWNALHRIFMSATVTDDAFLVKGLRLSSETILSPLTYEKERWSGEKMVLVPSLMDESLTRTEIVNLFGPPSTGRKYGIVALAPSFNSTKDWQACGARIATKDTIIEEVERLRQCNYQETVVLANRYDGIDLPDDTCRILIFDSKPYSENLVDLYQEDCRPDSAATLMRTVRDVEQGLGRSVRGEKDYSVIVLIGPDLVRLIRDKNSRKFLSSQMDTQIGIGLDVTNWACQEIEKGEIPRVAFNDVVRQCISRDADWKAFYVEQMEAVKPVGPNERILKLYEAELASEQAYQSGDYGGATKMMQKLLDDKLAAGDDRAWYLQQIARYNYKAARTESQGYQVAAYNGNRRLLRPPEGVTIAKLTIVSQGRVDRIVKWINQFENYQQLAVAVGDILTNLSFGVKADKFEHALDELSRAIGFIGERPDKEWKEGPDNLWALDDTQYILWECKNEVTVDRADVNKYESDQMNRSCSWFGKHYAGYQAKKILVIPTHKVASAAAFSHHDVQIMRVLELGRLVKAVRSFFKSFESLNLRDLSATNIQLLVDSHNLSVTKLTDSTYTKPFKNH